MALAEHCRRQGSLDVQTWHRAVLRSVGANGLADARMHVAPCVALSEAMTCNACAWCAGAHAGAPRSVVPDVVPRDTAAALLSLLTCFTQVSTGGWAAAVQCCNRC